MTSGYHIVVMANGELAWPERLVGIIRGAEVLMAVDGGANALHRLGIYPQVLVGDMDSVLPEALQACEEHHCRLVLYPPNKDETDTELALLEAVRLGAARITILGALGGRIDHTLANLLLLTLPELKTCQVVMCDGSSYITLLRTYGLFKGKPGDTLSLIPLGGDALGVRTVGLQYPLHDEVLRFGPARGISNVLVAEQAEIWLSSGLLLVVHTPQEWPND